MRKNILFGRLILLCLLSFGIPVSSIARSVGVKIDGCNYTCDTETGEATLWRIETTAESVVIPQVVIDDDGNKYTVTVIKSAETSLSSTTSITLPSTVHTIGTNAFQRCSSLRTINLENVKNIGSSAFYNCTSLEIVDLSSAVTIETSAFERCSALEGEITFAEGLEEIGYSVFMGCTKLSKVHFPASLKTIYSNAFAESGLVEVLIPDNVEAICDGVFDNCTSLKYVYLGKGINNWYRVTGVFLGCTSLETVVIECETVPNCCFKDDKALTTIDMRDGVKKIDNYAFSGCGIESLVIPDGVEEIVHTAFENCTNLKMVTIGKSLKNSTFIRSDSNCPVETVWIKSPIAYKYVDCPNTLKEVILGEEVTEIGRSAFAYNKCITSIHIPGNVKTIGDNAFSLCSALKTVEFEEGVETIKGAFPECYVLEEPILPNSLKTICRNAFGYNTFERLVIPDNVTTIEFGIAGQLKVISIPGLIENNKWNLYPSDTLIVRCEEPFDCDWKMSVDAVLQVPSATAVEKFRNHSIWGKFKQIVPAPVFHKLEGEIRLVDVENTESYDSEGIRIYKPSTENLKVGVKIFNKDVKPYKDLVYVALYTLDAEGNKSLVSYQSLPVDLDASGAKKGEILEFGAFDNEKTYYFEVTYYSYAKGEICCSLPAFKMGKVRQTPYDVNSDGILDANDIDEMVKLLISKHLYSDIMFADYNQDKAINAADLVILIRHIELLQGNQK